LTTKRLQILVTG